MLSEEEKKAIEYFKDDIEYLEDDLKYPNFEGKFITIRSKELNYLKIILNLIEKQQEELNKEKEKNEKIKRDYINPQKARISYFDTKKGSQVVIEGFISKDKIKDLFDLTINQFIEERYIGGEHLIVKVLKELRKELLED